MRISIVDKYFFCFLTLVLSLTTAIHAQVITPQNLEISKICAGSNNKFDATFNYSGFPAFTTFEVILSDNLGSFTNPTSTTTLATVDLSVSKKTITFAVPETLIGSETYSLRVKSSTGVVSAKFNNRDLNTSFPAYYKPYEEVYFINNKNPTAYLCSGGSITLAIDNPTPSIQNSSPSNYPNIKYKWYNNATVIVGQTGSSIIVNSAGTYYVEIDYASCTDSNSRSNSVTVTQVSGTVLPITSSLGNPFCSGGAVTTLTSATGNTHQWYKENVKIEGATENTYQTNQPGTYSVSIDYGNCQSNSVINLEAYQIESSINIASTSTLVSGETKTVVASSNAINPTYEWYQNDLLISGATSNTYDVTIEGSYKVIVTQNSGCIIQDEIPFVVNPVVDSNVTTIPNLISPNNDGINDTWVIPQEYAVGNNAEVLLMDSNGEIVLKTNGYLNNWPEAALDFKNINPVYYYIITTQDKKVKKGSITIVK